MNSSRLQSALREIRRHFSDPRVLAGMAIVAVLLGLAGPFGTFEVLGTAPRIVYWATIVLATYGVGFAFGVVLGHAIYDRLRQPALRVLVVGGLSGLPVTAAVVVINLLAFGAAGWTAIDLFTLWVDTTLVAMGVMTFSIILKRSPRPALQDTPDGRPALLERLPLPQRGALVCLSVEDHYVDVTTTKGHALVLMRLSDAIKEARPTPGLQIHRSHWVALDAVARTVRVDGKLLVETRDGKRLPVSRSYLERVREAGLMA